MSIGTPNGRASFVSIIGGVHARPPSVGCFVFSEVIMEEPITPQMLGRLMALHEVRVPLSIGRATVGWNTLSGAIFQHFRLLSGMDDRAASATFFAVASDRSQREMVGHLYDIKLKPRYPDLAKRGRSLLGRADKLAGKRNDILHVVYVDTTSPHKVSQLQERGHLKGKSGQVLLDAVDDVAIACLDLSIEMMELQGRVLETPDYQSLALAEALLKYGSQRSGEEVASQGIFGLLDSDPAAFRSLGKSPD